MRPSWREQLQPHFDNLQLFVDRLNTELKSKYEQIGSDQVAADNLEVIMKQTGYCLSVSCGHNGALTAKNMQHLAVHQKLINQNLAM